MNAFIGEGAGARRPWLTPGRITVLGTGGPDAAWLARWVDAPAWSSEVAGRERPERLVSDRIRVPLAEQADMALLAAAGRELLRYRFYPPAVASALGRFDLEDRLARDGDRVLQRLQILRAFGRPLVEVLSQVELRGLEFGPERWAFGYVTTERHPGRGEWRLRLERDAEARLWLTMTARAEPAWGRISGLPGIRWLWRRMMRHYQRRAHRLGIAAFRQRVQALARIETEGGAA